MGRVTALNRGIEATCDARPSRSEPLTGAVPVILTVSFKVAGPQVPTTAMESLDAGVLKLCKQKDCLSAIDSALARPTLYGHG